MVRYCLLLLGALGCDAQTTDAPPAPLSTEAIARLTEATDEAARLATSGEAELGLMAWERAHTVFHESLEAGIVDHHGRQAALSFDHHLGLLRSELKNRDESARTHAAELAATARAWAPLVPTS